MALFKIFKGNDRDKSKLNAMEIHDGYAYYNTSNGLFYIDAYYSPTEEQINDPNSNIVTNTASENYGLILGRRPLNAHSAFYDDKGNSLSNYIKEITLSNEGALSYTTGDNIHHPIGELNTNVVSKSGDTMTGALTLSGDPTNNLHAATKQYVDNILTTNDALVFKGVLGSDTGMIHSLPDSYEQGWVYKVGTAGTYAGQDCEIGDTIYCIADGTTVNNANWTIIQTNIDSTVIGPSESAGGVAVFTGNTGKAIRDSGFTISKSVPSDAAFTDILVRQTAKTDNDNQEYKILMGAQTNPTSGVAYEAVYDPNITINPSSHALTVQELILNGSAHIGHIKNDNNQVKFFGTNNTTSNLAFYIDLTDGTLGGVGGNDYAECRQVKDNIEPGRCVIETGNGDLILSTERLQPGAEIISDTYNLVIGQNETAKAPIAVTGRVLAYLYEDRKIAKSHIGWPVCSGPNGTVSIMTEEEASKYPWKIIGTISEVPNYNVWKSNLKEVFVNERIWIRIK